MSKVWFTSDTHFGSQRTLELSKRPFETVEEMDNHLIKNWNTVVSVDGTVFHLGDFGDYKRAKELNGKIILIRGSYEYDDLLPDSRLLEYGFDSVRDVYSKIIEGQLINMCHRPSKVKCNKEGINLFGHIHELCMVKYYGINVGVYCHNFKPIDIDTVLFYHNVILSNYSEEVFI